MSGMLAALVGPMLDSDESEPESDSGSASERAELAAHAVFSAIDKRDPKTLVKALRIIVHDCIDDDSDDSED
jgi:hypothetical protein